MRSAFAEKVAQGFYINIEVNRDKAARYGLTVGDVQRAITSGIGGMNIAENVEGRERYPSMCVTSVIFAMTSKTLDGFLFRPHRERKSPSDKLHGCHFLTGRP